MSGGLPLFSKAFHHIQNNYSRTLSAVKHSAFWPFEDKMRESATLTFLMHWNLILFRMIKGWTLSLLIQNMASTWVTLISLYKISMYFYLSKHYLLIPRMHYIWGQISNAKMHYISGRREYMAKETRRWKD